MSVLKQLQKYFIVRKPYYSETDNIAYLTTTSHPLHYAELFVGFLGLNNKKTFFYLIEWAKLTKSFVTYINVALTYNYVRFLTIVDILINVHSVCEKSYINEYIDWPKILILLFNLL